MDIEFFFVIDFFNVKCQFIGLSKIMIFFIKDKKTF
jgi:hypothetical protein